MTSISYAILKRTRTDSLSFPSFGESDDRIRIPVRNLYHIQCRRIILCFLNLVWELFSQKNPASTSLTYNYSKAYKNVCAKSDLSIHCKELKHLFLSHGSRVRRYVGLIKYKYSSMLICVFLISFCLITRS